MSEEQLYIQPIFVNDPEGRINIATITDSNYQMKQPVKIQKDEIMYVQEINKNDRLVHITSDDDQDITIETYLITDINYQGNDSIVTFEQLTIENKKVFHLNNNEERESLLKLLPKDSFLTEILDRRRD